MGMMFTEQVQDEGASVPGPVWHFLKAEPQPSSGETRVFEQAKRLVTIFTVTKLFSSGY